MPAAQESFGDWLIDVELPERGIELTEFAREIGVRRSTIYRWRERNPRASMVGRVARQLGLPYHELVERFGMNAASKKSRDNNDDENALIERVAHQLAAYPDDMLKEIMARAEAERRRQADGNRKDSER